jgi:thymidine kinase
MLNIRGLNSRFHFQLCSGSKDIVTCSSKLVNFTAYCVQYCNVLCNLSICHKNWNYILDLRSG